MSEVTVRRATPADATVLAEMRYEFRTAFGTPTETRDGFVRRAGEWMRNRLQPGSAWRCWVAEAGGEPVGHIWLELIEKIPNPVVELEKHGYITNAYVRESARSRGIGRQLLEAALECCRAEGVDSVILWPTSSSRTLYARHGFAPRDDVWEANLDDGRDLH